LIKINVFYSNKVLILGGVVTRLIMKIQAKEIKNAGNIPGIINSEDKEFAREVAIPSLSHIKTAIVPESIPTIAPHFVVRFHHKDKIINGEKIEIGDAIIGLASSGIHSNGYTLARKIISENNLSYKNKFPDKFYPGKTIGEFLLTPTQIYVKETIALLKKVKIHGLAHITGGGLRNLPRINKNVRFLINDPFKPQEIFKFLQKYGNIDDKEMYQTFNMGMGLIIVVAKEDAEESIKILKTISKSDVKIVGKIIKGKGVKLENLNLDF